MLAKRAVAELFSAAPELSRVWCTMTRGLMRGFLENGRLRVRCGGMASIWQCSFRTPSRRHFSRGLPVFRSDMAMQLMDESSF